MPLTNKAVMHIGIKTILATAMNRQEYNDYRGWELPSDEDGSDEGYLVEYVDGGQSNHVNHKGYISWSPKAVFDASYSASGSMSFSDVLSYTLAGDGLRIARKGWNGAGLSVYKLTPTGIEPHLVIRNPNTGKVNTWVPSSADLIANDWLVL